MCEYGTRLENFFDNEQNLTVLEAYGERKRKSKGGESEGIFNPSKRGPPTEAKENA
jgi:hypothetical protein